MTRYEVEAFLTIAEVGSLSAAAEKLYITQPALTRCLQNLEADLGYALFARSKGQRKSILTEEGKRFLKLADQLKHIYDDAYTLGNTDKKPVLRVAAIGSVGIYLMPQVIREAAGGDAPYHLDYHSYHSYEAYESIKQGLIDIAIIDDVGANFQLLSKTIPPVPLFEQDFVIIGGPELRRAGDRPVSPEQLDPFGEILLPWSEGFLQWHRAHFPLDSHPRLQMDQTAMLESLLVDGTYAIVPRTIGKNLSKGSLRVYELADRPPAETIYEIVQPFKRADGAVKHFLNILHRHL